MAIADLVHMKGPRDIDACTHLLIAGKYFEHLGD